MAISNQDPKSGVSANQKLAGKKIAILCTDGVEQVELTEPRKALDAAGAKTDLVSIKSGKIEAWKHFDKAEKFDVDVTVQDAEASEYDALVLPGGVANPDQLRADEGAVSFVRSFVESGKPIAAICHGPWTLIEAGGVKGKNMTSWPSLKLDLTNAGARWSDSEVEKAELLVTSRKPDDLPAFNAAMIELFSEDHSKSVSGEGQLNKQNAVKNSLKSSAAPSAQI